MTVVVMEHVVSAPGPECWELCKQLEACGVPYSVVEGYVWTKDGWIDPTDEGDAQ